MFKVVYTRESERNLDDIFSYIAEDNNTHAVKVLQKIYSTISRIKLFPYIGKILNKQLQEFVETKYKFRIIYEIDELNETIYINSIFKHKNNH